MYTLRLASSGKNRLEILGAVALGLDGYDSRLPRGSRVEVVVPCPREGSMFAPYLIGSGQVDGAFMAAGS